MDDLAELRADCSGCSALCCVALPYARSADFPEDKPAGRPCRHLDGFACSIHDRLGPRGFAGCVAFDCLGAGQLVTRRERGSSWRDRPDGGAEMFAVFDLVRGLQELRWYLRQADRADQPEPTRRRARELTQRIRGLTELPTAELLGCPVDSYRAEVDEVLTSVSRRVRAGVSGAVGDRTGRPRRTRGADLAGRELADRDLRGLDLRGALLIGADLRRSDLRGADLLGADLRGADLRGSDLSDALFVTEPQLAGARGDRTTRVPPGIRRPRSWPTR